MKEWNIYYYAYSFFHEFKLKISFDVFEYAKNSRPNKLTTTPIAVATIAPIAANSATPGIDAIAPIAVIDNPITPKTSPINKDASNISYKPIFAILDIAKEYK